MSGLPIPHHHNHYQPIDHHQMWRCWNASGPVIIISMTWQPVGAFSHSPRCQASLYVAFSDLQQTAGELVNEAWRMTAEPSLHVVLSDLQRAVSKLVNEAWRMTS